jgi:ribonuclease R
LYIKLMAGLPTKQDLLLWLKENPNKVSKREIAKAFSITGSYKIGLKKLILDLENEREARSKSNSESFISVIPSTVICIVKGPDKDGDIFLDLLDWSEGEEIPKIFYFERSGSIPVSVGDRILCELTKVEGKDYHYEAKLIRRISKTNNSSKIIGVFRVSSSGGTLEALSKRLNTIWTIPRNAVNGSVDGDIVEAEQTSPKSRFGMPKARVISILGKTDDSKAISLIAIHEHSIVNEFSKETLSEAVNSAPVTLVDRDDLRHIPFVTIDPADARDHDDACYVELDLDVENKGGFIVWIAIADVAHYVQPNSLLDGEARNRGNSTYFPDRVVPMLPENLSADLCSLHEGEDRPCLALKMILDSGGKKTSQQFFRGLMRSRGSLVYREVQEAIDGNPSKKIQPILESIIKPLYKCYEVLQNTTKERGPLILDLPERKILLDDSGKVASIEFLDRLDAHKVVEELMILANVAAAEELFNNKSYFLYRIHEEPEKEKVNTLREIVKSCGLSFSKGQVLKTHHLNSLLCNAKETEYSELVSMSILRSMPQAYYGAQPIGHFGLALRRYTHFTSPIRRYADLVTHRAIIETINRGQNPLYEFDPVELEAIGESISICERKSMLAERDTVDRYLAAFFSDRLGLEVLGTISGVARFGIFVKIDESGADGLVPVSTIGNEYFRYNREKQVLVAERTGLVLGLGKRVLVRLVETNALTGGLTLQLISVDGEKLSVGRSKKSFVRKRSGKKSFRKKKVK